MDRGVHMSQGSRVTILDDNLQVDRFQTNFPSFIISFYKPNFGKKGG